MIKKLKKLFNNKPWAEMKTRKLFLILSVVIILVYIVISLIFSAKEIMIDSALTENVFEFFKWLVMTGCVITVAKVVKGDTNSDDVEYIHYDEIEDEDEYDEEGE